MKKQVDEELRNLQLDKIDSKKTKTTEQLKRHTIDAAIESKPIDKALFLLQKGDDVQKQSVVQSLPKLLRIDEASVFGKVLPKIQQELPTSSSEFKICTSEIFQVLIETHLKTNYNFVTTIIQGIDSNEPVVATAWLNTLLAVIPILPFKTVQTEVVPMALSKGNHTTSVTSRLAGCKVLGVLAQHPQMKAMEMKKDILPLIYSLCQDVSHNVRACICEQIPAFTKVLGLVKNYFLTNLVELCADENLIVKATAVSAVVQISPSVDREAKMTIMVPLILNICSPEADLDDPSLVMLVKDIGLLLNALESCLSKDQTNQLLKFYEKLARRGLDTKDISIYNVDSSQDVKGREYCAFNFPSVMSFAIKSAPESTGQLYNAFKALSYDPCYLVRLTIAGVFHEVAKILGNKNHMMKTEYVRLLRDDAEEVLNALVPHISTTLFLFQNTGLISIERTDPPAQEIGKAMLKCLAQLNSAFNWRLTTTFLRQLENLPMVLKSDHIHNEFTPQVVQCCVKGRAKPIRIQSGRTLLFFLRWNPKQIQRTWLRDHLIHELAENKCCYTRQIFIELCKNAIELFSNKYFKENFYLPLLRLSNDRVSIIRYCLVSLLPRLRKMLQMPSDKKLLQLFDTTLIHLEKEDKDRDVLENIIKQTKDMSKRAISDNMDDSTAIEKRLVEEEENISKGKLVFNVTSPISRMGSVNTKPPTNILTGSPGMGTVAIRSRSQSVHRVASSSAASTRSTSVPRPIVGSSGSQIISDMTFLKQHFYIDAGVHLPIEKQTSTDFIPESLGPEKTVSMPNLATNLESLTIENTPNITDDVKVNLRRKKFDKSSRHSQSEIPTAKAKRHSSIYTSIMSNNSPVNKRRSLNIQQKELSKIPIMKDSKGQLRIDEEKKEVRRHSGLPVPVRRTNAPK